MQLINLELVLMESDLNKFPIPSNMYPNYETFSTKYCVITKKEFKIYQNKDVFNNSQSAHRIIPIERINKAFIIDVKCKHKSMVFFTIEIKNNKDTNSLDLKREKESSNVTTPDTRTSTKSKHFI